VSGVLLVVLGVVFGGDLVAAVKRWQRDLALEAAVDKQRQAVVAQFQKLEQFAKDLDQVLPSEVRSGHEAVLGAADAATSAEDDAQAKTVLTEGEQQLRRHQESLQQKAQGTLVSQGDGLTERRDRLKKLGDAFESAPPRHRQEVKSLRDKLSGSSKLDESARREYGAELDRVQREMAIADAGNARWQAQAPALLEELATKISAVTVRVNVNETHGRRDQ